MTNPWPGPLGRKTGVIPKIGSSIRRRAHGTIQPEWRPPVAAPGLPSGNAVPPDRSFGLLIRAPGLVQHRIRQLVGIELGQKGIGPGALDHIRVEFPTQ